MLIAKNWKEVVKQHTLKLNNTHNLVNHYKPLSGELNIIGLHDDRYIAYRGLGKELPLSKEQLFDIALSGSVALVILMDEGYYQDEDKLNTLRQEVQKLKTLGIVTLDVIRVLGDEPESIQL